MFAEHYWSVLAFEALEYRKDEEWDYNARKGPEDGRFSLTVLLSLFPKYFKLASFRKRGLYRLLVLQLLGLYVPLFIDLLKLSVVLGVAVRGL